MKKITKHYDVGFVLPEGSVSYKELSTGLKWAIVGGYVGLVSFAIGFLIGFFGAL